MWNEICIYWALFIYVILVGDLERVLLNKCVGKFIKNFEIIYILQILIHNFQWLIYEVLKECHVWRGIRWN